MSLVSQITEDMKAAMRAKDRLRLDTVRMIKAAIQHKSIELRSEELSDEEVLQVLNKQAKQCKDTIEMAQKNERQDILDQATQELAIISAYLPKQLSDDELESLVREAVSEHGQNRGAVIKAVMAKAAGGADGKRINELVSKINNESNG